MEEENEIEYVVESIVDKRFVKRKGKPPVPEYMIHWAGYPSSDDSWLSVAMMGGCLDMMRGFDAKLAAKKALLEEKTGKRKLANGRSYERDEDGYAPKKKREAGRGVKEEEEEKVQSGVLPHSEDSESCSPLEALINRMKTSGGKITKTKNIHRKNPLVTRFKIEFFDKEFVWESLETIKQLNIQRHITKFLKTYMRKKPDGVDEDFITYFETFLDISLATLPEVIEDVLLPSPHHQDDEWIKLQTMNIPHYTTWMKLFKHARHPWPLIENTVDASGPPLNFSWVDNNIKHVKSNEEQNEFIVGCDCSKFAYQECSPVTCSCATAWDMEHAYANNGILSPDFSGNIIIECNDKCDCSSSCPNRVVQNKATQRFVIFKCNNAKGWGLKTMVDIPCGALIDEYVGEIITNDEAEKRGLRDLQRGITYLFDLDAFVVAKEGPDHAHWPKTSTFTLDANYFGNATHFLNHSCRPNVSSYAVIIDSVDPAMHRIAFFSLRDISAGEELVFNYAGRYFDNEDVLKKYKGKGSKTSVIPNDVNSFFKCLCGEKGCQGFIRFRD